MRKNEMELLEELKKLNAAIKQLANSKEDISDEAIDAIRSEQARLHEFIDMPEVDFNRLYDIPNADIASFTEAMNAKEVECRVIGDRAVEDAIALTKAQMDCVDAINTLLPEQEALTSDSGIELDTERTVTIAEHPICYAIMSLKKTIADISEAKTSLYESGIEYKGYKKQVADAITMAGNTAYYGVIAPIQSATIDTIEDIADKSRNLWQSACNKFHAVKEKICNAVSKVVEPIKTKAMNMHNAVIETTVNIHNAVMDYYIDQICEKSELLNEVANKVGTKAISYTKAGKEIAKTEEQLKSQIDSLLGTETYTAKAYTPNPAITAQIDALRKMFPDDVAVQMMNQSKERLLAKEEKNWNKQEARIEKTDTKLTNKMIKETARDLRKIEKIHGKSDARLARAGHMLDTVEFIRQRLNADAINVASSKWQVVTNSVGKSTIDNGADKRTNVEKNVDAPELV